MAWPSKNPDDYEATPRWGAADPGSPPVSFGVAVLAVVVAGFGALAVASGEVAFMFVGCASVPGAAQAAWWIRRRIRR